MAESNAAYHIPIGNLGSGDVLDGHVSAVAHAHAGVDRAEAALAEHLAHAVRPLEGLAGLNAHVIIKTCNRMFTFTSSIHNFAFSGSAAGE